MIIFQWRNCIVKWYANLWTGVYIYRGTFYLRAEKCRHEVYGHRKERERERSQPYNRLSIPFLFGRRASLFRIVPSFFICLKDPFVHSSSSFVHLANSLSLFIWLFSKDACVCARLSFLVDLEEIYRGARTWAWLPSLGISLRDRPMESWTI